MLPICGGFLLVAGTLTLFSRSLAVPPPPPSPFLSSGFVYEVWSVGLTVSVSVCKVIALSIAQSVCIFFFLRVVVLFLSVCVCVCSVWCAG